MLTMLGVAVRALARLPPQDLGYDLSRVPARPRSGVVLAPERSADQAARRA